MDQRQKNEPNQGFIGVKKKGMGDKSWNWNNYYNYITIIKLYYTTNIII